MMLPPESSNHPGALARTPQPLSDGLLSQSSLMVPGGDYAPSAEPEGDSSVTFSALLQALSRRWPLALGVALVGTVLTVGVIMVVMPAKYTAQTRLKVDSRGQRQIFSTYSAETEPSIWKGNQEAIIKSHEILNAALNNDKVKHLEVAKGPTDWLEKALKIDFLLGPEIMRLALSGDRQDEVAPLLNAIVDEYLTSMDKDENARREKLLERLKSTQRMLKTQLEVKRAELRRVCQEHGIEDPETARGRYSDAVQELNQARKEYREFKSDLDKKKRTSAEIQARLKTLDTETVPPFVIDKHFQQSQFLQEHLKNLAEINKQIVDIRRFYQPEQAKKMIDEAMKERDLQIKAYEADCNQLRPEIERKIRAEIRDTLDKLLSELKVQIENGQELVKNQQRQVDDLDQAVRQLNPSGGVTRPEVGKLSFEIEQFKDELKLVSGEVAKLNMEPMPASRVLRLQEAATPDSKDHSRQFKYAAVGGLGVFGLLLFGVAYWECRKRRVHATTEVTQSLRMSVLGTLPALPRRVTGQLTKSGSERERQWQSLMTESIDAIRTLLLHSARTDALQVVMVTSAGDGEGKTSLASQLAASLARAWRKTLLVDGDLRNPAAHKLFDVPQDPGFSEVLRGEVILGDVIRPTPLGRLWLLPAGRWDSHALQALAQEEVHKLFAQLKDSYDFIVVDSCPVLPVTDSLLLGQHVDAVIFSILRDVSRMPAVQAAQKRLQALGIRTFGAVVLGADGEVSGRSYQFPGQLVGSSQP